MPTSTAIRALLTSLLLFSAIPKLSAASGTWTNLAGGSWGDSLSWLNGTIADGPGSTADFSTLDLTADTTVSLDTTRTVSSLIFGDTNPTGSPANWILDNAGNVGNLLELAAPNPTITVNSLGTNNNFTAAISAQIDGTNGLIKAGPGILALNTLNTYTNGTMINGGIIVMNSTAATLGSNIVGNVVTFNGGALSNNWGANNQVSVNNSLVVPTGQTGTIYMGNRIRLAANGNPATITGGGTLNFVANSTVTRDDIGAQCGAFTGTVNFVGSGGLRFFVNAGVFSGFSNAVVNINGPQFWNFNDNSGGNPFSFGALNGTNTTAQVGFTSAGGAPRLIIGQLNQDSTFVGQFVNTAHLIKVGAGSFTLPGNHTHNGTNFVGAGKLIGVTGGSMSNSVSVVVANGATFAVLVSPAGNQWVGPAMTNYSGSSLQFNYGGSIASTTLAPLLIRGNFSPSNTVNLSVIGGNWTVGVFPLLKYTNTLAGDGFGALSLAGLPARVQGYLSNDTASTSIDLVVTNTTQPLRWATGSGTWDTSSANWVDLASAPATYQESGGFGDSVLFEDVLSGSSPITTTLSANLVPAAVNVSATKDYTFSGTGGLGGFASLTKSGSGTLTVSTSNSFTGGVFINGGVLSFSSLANLGDSQIKFAGGTLKYASGNTADISGHAVTFNAGDATIDVGANDVNYAGPVGNNGPGGLTKTGSGNLTLNGANNYSGNTVISQGILSIGSGTISNSSAIVISTGTKFSGGTNGQTLNGTIGQVLAGSGAILGALTAPAGARITPGTNGVAASLSFSNDLVLNGGTLVYDVSTNSVDRDQMKVAGALTLNSGSVQLLPSTLLTNGTYRLIQQSSLAGSAGNLLLTGFSQPGQIAFLSDAIAGEIDLVVATGGTNNLVWGGSANAWDVGITADWLNGATPSVFEQGDTVTFDTTGSANSTVNLAGPIYPTAITVNGADYTLQDGSGTGQGKLIGPTGITKAGAGTLTILTVNNNIGPTVINGGAVHVGNGSTTGSLGSGNITNNAALIFAQPDDRSVAGVIGGSGSLSQVGTATLTLTRDSTYTGPTTISSGMLQIGAGTAAGSLGSGPVTNIGTLAFNRSGTFAVTNGITGSGVPNPASIVKLGSGTMTLSGVNTYEGNTFISNGVVKLGAAEVIPDGGATTGWLILDGADTAAGTLDLNGFNETVNGLSGLGGTVVGRILNSVAGATNRLTINQLADNTFAGNILDNAGTGGRVAITKAGASALTLSGASTYSGGTIVAAGTLNIQGGGVGTGELSLSNGVTLNLLGNGLTFPGNTIRTPAGATDFFTAATLNSGYAGLFVSGDSTSTNDVIGGISISSPNVKQFSNFTGVVQIELAGTVRFSSTSLSVNGGDSATFVVNGLLNTRNGTGNAATNGVRLGALFGSGGVGGASGADGNSVYLIGGKGTDCTFSGTISGTAPRGTAITKIGAGTLTLDGTLTCDGATTVSNGVLALAGTANLDSVTNPISVKAGAFLDVNGIGGTLTLGNVNMQTLSGSGTIRGSVTVNAGSTIAPGDPTGTLTITNVLNLSGTNLVSLNRTNAQNCGTLVAQSFVINPGATLVVTNIGPGNFSPGDTFVLFSQPVSGVTVAQLPPLPCNKEQWTNKLSIDGTLAVIGTQCPSTDPTNITAVVSGSNLSLSWPIDHLGWLLQVQTNSLNIGLSNNWVTITGSDAVTGLVVPLDPANGAVFYRLILQP